MDEQINYNIVHRCFRLFPISQAILEFHIVKTSRYQEVLSREHNECDKISHFSVYKYSLQYIAPLVSPDTKHNLPIIDFRL